MGVLSGSEVGGLGPRRNPDEAREVGRREAHGYRYQGFFGTLPTLILSKTRERPNQGLKAERSQLFEVEKQTLGFEETLSG